MYELTGPQAGDRAVMLVMLGEISAGSVEEREKERQAIRRKTVITGSILGDILMLVW